MIFQQEPCILYETVELLYAFVNGVSPEQLTVEGSYCIPAGEILRIQSAACDGLDPQDPALQLYFGQQAILDESNQFTCLASCMVRSFMNLEETELTAQMDSMCVSWERIRRRPFCIRAISWFALDIEAFPAGSSTSLASEMKKLPVGEAFFLSLLETFSDYNYHMAQLRELISPVAQRLRSLLEPYVRQAAPLREIWHQFFQVTTLEAFTERRTGFPMEKPFDHACICMRYFKPQYAPIQVDPACNTFNMHLGVGVQPPVQQPNPSEQDLQALRLLGDKIRSDMVRILMGRPMSMQELATQLDINPGTIFRNLNSLTNTGLLTTEVRGSRYYYQANLPFIQGVFQKMLEYYRTGRQNLPEQKKS